MTFSINPYAQALVFIEKMELLRFNGDYDDRYYFGLAKGYLQALDENNLISTQEYNTLFNKISYLDPNP